MWPQRTCTMPTLGSSKWPRVFSRMSAGATKSASKIRTNSPFADLQAGVERARLVAGAVVAVDVVDVEALRSR